MSSQENHAHKRRFVRASVDFPATVIVPGHELILIGKALDLSRGGMRIATSTDLPAGQPIMVRFTLPNGTRELLVRAHIVLSFYEAATQTYSHGVAFTQSTSQDFDEISAWLNLSDTHEAPQR